MDPGPRQSASVGFGSQSCSHEVSRMISHACRIRVRIYWVHPCVCRHSSSAGSRYPQSSLLGSVLARLWKEPNINHSFLCSTFVRLWKGNSRRACTSADDPRQYCVSRMSKCCRLPDLCKPQATMCRYSTTTSNARDFTTDLLRVSPDVQDAWRIFDLL
jgi:hypothetical protein